MKRFALLLAAAPLVSFSHPAPIHQGHDNETAQDQPNIVQVASDAGTFKTLLAAAKAAGLAEVLATGGPFTVFAPTDAAFAKLPKSAIDALLLPENKAKLAEVLSFHVVSGTVDAAAAINAKSANALTGGTLRFSIQDGRLRVNDANVIANDIAASNGVVHVIDSVLSPPSGLAPKPAGRLVVGVYTEAPSKALCAQLGIDRHGSLLITGVTSAGTAREAGMEKYDVLLAIDGEPATEKQLKSAKERAQFGGTIDFVFLRQGEKQQKHVKVGIERH